MEILQKVESVVRLCEKSPVVELSEELAAALARAINFFSEGQPGDIVLTGRSPRSVTAAEVVRVARTIDPKKGEIFEQVTERVVNYAPGDGPHGGP